MVRGKQDGRAEKQTGRRVREWTRSEGEFKGLGFRGRGSGLEVKERRGEMRRAWNIRIDGRRMKMKIRRIHVRV
jgi:hypothetical protein